MGDTGLEHPSGFLNTQLVLISNIISRTASWRDRTESLYVLLFGLGLVSRFSEPSNTALLASPVNFTQLTFYVVRTVYLKVITSVFT